MCMNLFCEKPDGYCSSNDEPAADGTECLANKVQKKLLLSPPSVIRRDGKIAMHPSLFMRNSLFPLLPWSLSLFHVFPALF